MGFIGLQFPPLHIGQMANVTTNQPPVYVQLSLKERHGSFGTKHGVFSRQFHLEGYFLGKKMSETELQFINCSA